MVEYQPTYQTACTDIANLDGHGAGISIAVNVAVAQLTDSFATMVDDILRASGLAASRLHLAITEGSLVRAFGPAATSWAVGTYKDSCSPGRCR